MSASFVCQLDTDRRMALRPSNVVPLIQASPLSTTRRRIRSVASSSSNRKRTWLITTSFRSWPPGTVARPSANVRACVQVRSTSSATPRCPRDRSAA